MNPDPVTLVKMWFCEKCGKDIMVLTTLDGQTIVMCQNHGTLLRLKTIAEFPSEKEVA